MTTQDDKLQSGRHSQSPWVDLRDLFPAEEPLLASQEDTGSDEPQPISPPPVSPIDRAGDNEGKTSPTGFSPRQETHSPYRGVPSTRPQREANVRVGTSYTGSIIQCNGCRSSVLDLNTEFVFVFLVRSQRFRLNHYIQYHNQGRSCEIASRSIKRSSSCNS